MSNNFFYFGIETTTKYRSFDDFCINDKIGSDLFINKCDNMKKYDLSWSNTYEQLYIEKAPLIPEYGKIICFSWGLFDKGENKIGSVIEKDELSLLIRSVKILNRIIELKKILCGFNIKIFDIPYIVKKLYKYNIDIPKNIDLVGVKPWEMNVVDICEIWKGTGRNTSSLDEITYELDIDHKKIIKGEDIFFNFWNGDINNIIKSCENNIISTIKISEKIKLK